MENRTKAIIGAAAGVAGAATMAGMYAMRRSGAAVTAYQVVAGEDGWSVQANGDGSVGETFATKREAVTTARKLAAKSAPSHLVIQRLDGSIQTQHAYGTDGD